MNKQKLYELGKDFYYENKHEERFDLIYSKMDDLLDSLDDLRLEIKILIEEKNETELSPEDKLQNLYKELSAISEEMDRFDTQEADNLTKEMEKFKAKNKYRFIQVENIEKKYALAIQKGESQKSLAVLKENLKKMKLNTLNLQKKLDKFQEQIKVAKGDFLKLEAKKMSILKEITNTQQAVHKEFRKSGDSSILETINIKKSKLDNTKKEIKKTFFKIGQEAFNNKLK